MLAIILLSLILILFYRNLATNLIHDMYQILLHYNQGIVVEISNENIEYDEGLKLYLGTQDLKVKMTEGNEKGSIIEVTNYLTKTHSVYAKENMRLIINVDTPDDIEPYYTVFNYDRRFSMAAWRGNSHSRNYMYQWKQRSEIPRRTPVFDVYHHRIPTSCSLFRMVTYLDKYPDCRIIYSRHLTFIKWAEQKNSRSHPCFYNRRIMLTDPVRCHVCPDPYRWILQFRYRRASADQRKYQSADSRRPICQRVNCISGSYHGRWHVHRLCLV